MIGKILKERYKIYDKVGSGGVASVFIARDLQTYEVVAVKILKEEYTSNPNFIKRFIREAEVVSALHHQNITAVKDFGVEDNQYFIVMEYVEGKMLAQIVEEKGCIPPEQTIDVIIQVLSALEYAWENGIVAHRDIKPQNIMLDKNGVIKVMDFGIARVSSSHTMTQAGTFLGTPYYMSPEQAQGKETDIRSDIYSVGISIFQLVCGKVPFDADTPWSVVNMHITQVPPCIQVASPYQDLCKVIDKSLAKKVEDRYQTPKEMQADLEALKKGSSLSLSSSGTMVGEVATGEINVTSNPSGARVYLGTELKGVTPTLIRNLPPKSYKIRIEKEGYKTEEKTCQVTVNKRTVVDQSMKATISKQNTGQTMIPMNTNQTYVGETSSQQMSPMQERSQSAKQPFWLWGVLGIVVISMIVGGILLLKPKNGGKSRDTDYSNQIANTVVNNTTGSTTSGNMTSSTTKLSIESDPQGAEIYLDGTSLSQVTPYVVQNVQPGKHEVTVVLNNQKASQTIQVATGEIKQVKLILPIQNENQIDISSNPSGASIMIDGKDTGFVTPRVIKTEKGIHEVRLSLPGYEIFEIQVNVSGNVTVSGNLVKSGISQGSISLKTNPSGAIVSINGKSYGSSPVTITLPPGSYTAIFTLSGYKNETKIFEIKANEQTNLEITLTKITTTTPPPTQKTGTIQVTSSPSGANIYINGKGYGSTPKSVTLPVGSYTIRLTMSGYYEASQSVQINQNENKSIFLTLKKIPPAPVTPKTGVIKISTTPSGAEVYINGSFKGMSPLTLTLNNGSYSVKVVLEGYESASKTITVYGGQTSNASFQLKKKNAGPAILKIFSNPDGAEVYIDGNLVGLTDDSFKISAGTHKILIRLEGYKDFIMTITVKEGETREIRATLTSK